MICGAPGSGTSFATKILRYSGMFAGSDAGPIHARKFHESVSFRNANKQILASTIRSPHSPKKYNQFSAHITVLEDRIGELVSSIDIDAILDNYWSGCPEHCLWGWKDPRNSANVLLWKTIFPEIRIVIVKKKWRWAERKKKGTLAGTWFRTKSDRRTRKLYSNPPHIVGLDCFCLDVDKFMRDPAHLISLWKWLGLSEDLFVDHKEFKLLVKAEDSDE